MTKINRGTPLFMTKIQEFNAYKKSPRRIINLAKNYYFKRNSKKIKKMEKTWETLDNVLHKKLQNLRLMPYKLMINYIQIKRK